MKKFLLFCIVIFSFIITGCNSYKQENQNITTIKFSSWGSQTEYGILQKTISEFEKKNPDIKIELIHIPENYFRKLHLLYASKTAPDVVFVNNTYAPLYIQAGLFEDLTGKFNEKLFYKSAVDCFKTEGKIYAIPRDISNLVIYINKNIVKNPERIKTIDDLRKVAKESTTENIFGLNYEKQPLFWLYYLEYYGGGILSDNGKEVIINAPESIRGINIYANMINKDNSIPHEWQMSSMTSAQMFISGRIAMYLSGRWLVPKFRETLNFDWDIIPFPKSKSSKYLTDASGWAISKSSKHKEEALKFIEYLYSEEVIKEYTKTGLITPARIDTAQSPVFLDTNKKPKNSKVFIEILQDSKPTPVNTNYAKITDSIIKVTEPIFSGKSKTEEIITKKYTEKLQKYCDNSL